MTVSDFNKLRKVILLSKREQKFEPTFQMSLIAALNYTIPKI